MNFVDYDFAAGISFNPFSLYSCSGLGHFILQVCGCDLTNGAGEPGAGPEKPGAKGPGCDDAYGDWSVIERLVGNGVGGGQAEDDADEADPEHAYGGHGFGHGSEPKGTASEIGWKKKPDENGDAV